jgi:hypothetical protein
MTWWEVWAIVVALLIVDVVEWAWEKASVLIRRR